MRKKIFRTLFCVVCISLFSAQTHAFETTVGNYRLNIDDSSGKVNIYQGSTQIIKDSQASFKVNGSTYTIGSGSATSSAISDALGSGTKVVYKGTVNGWTVEQNFYLYPSKNYLATDFTVEIGSGTLSSNYMAPIKTSSAMSISANRVLRVPFDNDDFVRYESNNFGGSNTSYEVTALYYESTSAHQGLIVGSIDHETWKTGIKTSTSSNSINSMEIFGGITAYETRDWIDHASVKLKKIKSPKIFIGYYSDWRGGMEDYGKANRLIAPKYFNWSNSFNGKKPFGWNSWAALADRITYDNCNQTAEWVKNNIQNQGFKSEDNMVYMGLDSYWNEPGFGGDEKLKQFVDNCHARGQKAGVYLVPFSHWGGSPPHYALRIGGQFRTLNKKDSGGWCLDPTHPDTKKRAEEEFLNRIKKAGFDYIKIDFLGHGALEGDYWYDNNIQTGIQAYNYGMKWLSDWFKNNMPNIFVNLSIAPLFPGQYAQSRRISCDAWADISQSEYVLNSLSYGWWLDYVYDYNDADHVKFEGASIGENRARYTSSIITGIVILGDDYSGGDGHNSTAKNNTKSITTNADINQIAYHTKAFRPLRSGSGNRAAEIFYQTGGGYTYVAIFNYEGSNREFTVNFSELELNSSFSTPVKELWSGNTTQCTGSWKGWVNGKDCVVLRLNTCTDTTDSDGDGVPDCRDMCPGTPAGKAVDESGCPLPDPNEDDDGDGVINKNDLCPNTPPGTKVDATGCPRFDGKVIANFEDIQLTSHAGDANIKTREIRDTPDAPATCPSLKSLYVETNATVPSGDEGPYGSGITLNFPAINIAQDGQYMHFFFKTNVEKVEFRINGDWGPKLNPRTAVVNNGWFDYVVDLSKYPNLSQIKIMFDMRTGGSCDTSAPFQSGYNNHNKYMYIEDVVLSKTSTPRSSISCECEGGDCGGGDYDCPGDPRCPCTDCNECPENPDCSTVECDPEIKANIADFENGTTGGVTSVAINSGTSGLALDNIADNPSKTTNISSKAFKISTTNMGYHNGNGWESGINLKFNTAISAGSYIHFAVYTTLEKIEFPGRGNVIVTSGAGTDVINGPAYNELRPIAQNRWFDVVVPVGEVLPAGQEFVIWIDSRVNEWHNNSNKVLYIDEIKTSTNGVPRTSFGCSIPTSLNLSEINKWMVYVNSTGQIVVNVPNDENAGGNNVSIYNISGQKIAGQVLTGTETVVNARLAAGVYLIKLQQNNTIKTSKVVVF